MHGRNKKDSIDTWLKNAQKEDLFQIFLFALSRDWKNKDNFDMIYTYDDITYSLSFINDGRGEFELDSYEELNDDFIHASFWN